MSRAQCAEEWNVVEDFVKGVENSIQKSGMCTVKRSSHPMKVSHPSVKRVIGLSQSLLFCVSQGKQYTRLDLQILYVMYFLGTHPIPTATVLTYICLYMLLSPKRG